MNWFFLSAFAERLRCKEDAQVKMGETKWKNAKFNEMYVRDKSRTEKLYSKFVQTKAFKNFLNSSSLSNCFN